MSGDITTLTNVVGNIDSLIDEDGNVIASYNEIFKGGTGLVSAEELILPGKKLSEGCYSQMFEGCTSLTSAPELPATALANSCYLQMFKDCASLTSAPKLPATTLVEGCYSQMFEGCTSLTNAPKLPATALANSCYLQMFKDCASLTSASELPATELAIDCYNEMFINCESLQSAPELPATTLEEGCYSHMFDGCKALTKAPELPATELKPGCYDKMFINCEALQSAPSNLPAMELLDSCYSCMFSGCTSLTNAPKLPATKLAVNCYANMFSGCISLKRAPNLPARELKRNCYTAMFENCSGLEKAPDLLNLNMTGIDTEDAPPSCCENMFRNCTALKLVPNITVESLTRGCFSSMFAGCTGLVDIHRFSVPSSTLEDGCFYYMFSGCRNLALRRERSEEFNAAWDFSAQEGGNQDAFLNAVWYMFDGCDVNFGDAPTPCTTYYLKISLFNITIEESGNGTASATSAIAGAGDEILLTADPDEGFVFDRWESDDVYITDNKFIMPDKDVNIKAIFRRVGSEPKPAEQKTQTVYVDLDTFKSELPGGTVLTMDTDDLKKIRDMKVHSLDNRTVANQKIITDFYASQMQKKAKILHTYGIYTRSEVPILNVGERKVLAWNNLSIKTPGSIYAACYNQKDGAYIICGTVNERGTAVFFDFKLHEATNVTIFVLE